MTVQYENASLIYFLSPARLKNSHDEKMTVWQLSQTSAWASNKWNFFFSVRYEWLRYYKLPSKFTSVFFFVILYNCKGRKNVLNQLERKKNGINQVKNYLLRVGVPNQTTGRKLGQTREGMLAHWLAGRPLIEQVWHCELTFSHTEIPRRPIQEISHPTCQLRMEITSEDAR